MRRLVFLEKANNFRPGQLPNINSQKFRIHVFFECILAGCICIDASQNVKAFILEPVAQATDSAEEVNNVDLHG
jgi:hypothetical protein